MRVVPINEMVERIAHAAPCALLFPFDSPRAARSGDPAVHMLRDAQELFVLALLRLTARLGEPDFPSPDEPTPRDISGSMLPFAAWDYDYHALVLEIVPIDGVGDAYSVQLRRTSGVQFMSGSARSPLHEARTFADLERFLLTWTNFRGGPAYDAIGIAMLFLGCLDNMRRSYIEADLEHVEGMAAPEQVEFLEKLVERFKKPTREE